MFSSQSGFQVLALHLRRIGFAGEATGDLGRSHQQKLIALMTWE